MSRRASVKTPAADTAEQAEFLYPAFALAELPACVHAALNPDPDAPLRHRFLNPNLVVPVLEPNGRDSFHPDTMRWMLQPGSGGDAPVEVRLCGGPRSFTENREGYFIYRHARLDWLQSVARLLPQSSDKRTRVASLSPTADFGETLAAITVPYKAGRLSRTRTFLSLGLSNWGCKDQTITWRDPDNSSAWRDDGQVLIAPEDFRAAVTSLSKLAEAVERVGVPYTLFHALD